MIALPFGTRVHLEPLLDWQCYSMDRPRLIIAGTERYPQFVYAIEVKPRVLDIDPGPLDARVP